MKLLKVIPLYKSEKRLVEKAIANSRKAQKELYDTHAPKMLSVCRYYIKDIHEAEDIMLTAFFKAFQKLKTFKNEGNFEGWLRRIMVNECLSFLRKKKEVYLRDDLEIESKEAEDEIGQAHSVIEIQEAIDDLPPGYKMVFVLYAIEGYKHQEIAETLQISESTSKSQLFKARKFLQKKLQEKNSKEHETG